MEEHIRGVKYLVGTKGGMEGGTEGVDGGGSGLQQVHDVVGVVYLERREVKRERLDFSDNFQNLLLGKRGKEEGSEEGEGWGNGVRDEGKRLSFQTTMP